MIQAKITGWDNVNKVPIVKYYQPFWNGVLEYLNQIKWK